MIKFLLKDKELRLLILSLFIVTTCIVVKLSVSNVIAVVLILAAMALLWQVMELYMNSLLLTKKASVKPLEDKKKYEFVKKLY